jgi:TolB-like protein/Flp pilus assembly protein TadD
MDCALHFIAAERGDDPLDLPPMAEARDIAVVAAALGARCGLEPGIVAIPVDQGRRIGKRHATMDERSVHAVPSSPRPISRLPTNVVNIALTMLCGRGVMLMSDVFISYKAEDRRRVKPLVEALQADGFSVWWDEQIGGGDEWRRSIERELDAAKCVLVVWSKRSTGPEGRFVRDEASRAMERGVYLPVRIDNIRLPLGFGETQALALTGWKGQAEDEPFRAVLAAVKAIATGRPYEGHRRHFEAGVSRRGVIGGGAVAAVAVAGVGGWFLLRPDSAQGSNSIAVLPFANLSGDPTQAYFSDGMAEEIRSSLARIAGLKVVGRISSEVVRSDDAQTAAKKLQVATILTGSVRRSQSTIRVSAQVIDGKTGLERWSQDYDRKAGDALKIQSDIAENVAQAFSITLGSAARAVLTAGDTENPTAHNLVLQANQLSFQDTRPAFQHALELIGAALQIDPNYGYAYAIKARILSDVINSYAREAEEIAQGQADALQNARKAISLAPNLAAAHFALAFIYRNILQLGAAFSEFKRAFALAPGDPDTLSSYASFLSLLNAPSQAIQLVDRAVALDPLNAESYLIRATVLFRTRRYADVVRMAENLKRRSPELFNFPLQLGNSLTMLGRTGEAAIALAQGPVDFPFRLTGEGVLAARTGNRAVAMQRMTRLQQLYGEASSFQHGEIYAQLGDADQAIASLRQAWVIKEVTLINLHNDPWLDPVRGDPRFTALEKKLNFAAVGSA